jgi:hypothetical protein
MNTRVLLAARWMTSAVMAIASISAIRHGTSVWIESAELIAAIVFAIPVIWRIGGFLLLAVIAAAFVLHATSGHPPLMLLFPAMVIVMVMVIQP